MNQEVEAVVQTPTLGVGAPGMEEKKCSWDFEKSLFWDSLKIILCRVSVQDEQDFSRWS